MWFLLPKILRVILVTILVAAILVALVLLRLLLGSVPRISFVTFVVILLLSSLVVVSVVRNIRKRKEYFFALTNDLYGSDSRYDQERSQELSQELSEWQHGFDRGLHEAYDKARRAFRWLFGISLAFYIFTFSPIEQFDLLSIDSDSISVCEQLARRYFKYSYEFEGKRVFEYRSEFSVLGCLTLCFFPMALGGLIWRRTELYFGGKIDDLEWELRIKRHSIADLQNESGTDRQTDP